MGYFKLGPNFAIFILFFGLALVEAFKRHQWPEAILFIILGLLFLRAERKLS